LGSGEHYFIDLIVAAPFTVLVLALTDLLVGRGRSEIFVPLLVGLGTVLTWFVTLRFATRLFWVSPVVPWMACLLTVLVSFWAGKKLLGVEEQPMPSRKPMFAARVAEGVPE
jgi:hypothetical protein